MKPFSIGIVILTACALPILDGAQGPAAKPPGKALASQSQSSINYSTAADGSKTGEIHKVT